MKDKNIVAALYVGERALVNVARKEIVKTFRLENGETVNFLRTKGVMFGGSYEYNKKDMTMAIRPKFTNSDMVPTSEEKKDYEVHKELVKQIRLERKKQIELKKPHQDITAALNLLRPFTKNMSFHELELFGRYLREQLSKRK